jgi:predicted acetyltransferase
MQLVRPTLEYLPSYKAALERGWSPDNLRGAEAAREQLDAIAIDAAGFVAGLEDIEAKGGPVKLPDGSLRPRLPGCRRWMWDGDFCGSIGFRWRPGTSALPNYVLGHIGYAVVPWKRGRGYARQALKLLLPDAKARGLDYVELTTEPDNIPSQRVIVACGGEFVERFHEHEAFGGREGFRYRLTLTEASAP